MGLWVKNLTAVAWVSAEVRVLALVQELPYVVCVAIRKSNELLVYAIILMNLANIILSERIQVPKDLILFDVIYMKSLE